MTDRLNIAVISNGIEGIDSLYLDSEWATYSYVKVSYPFTADLQVFDVLLVPNGSDHVFMEKIQEQVSRFLASGKVVMCFDGWFTPWIPGNRWVMDISVKSLDIRYRIQQDPFGICDGVDMQLLSFSNGISGWWACGYIEPAKDAVVVVEDTAGRPLLVVDKQTTNGTLVLSASAPLSDVTYATTDDDQSMLQVAALYNNIIKYIHSITIKESV